MPHKISDEVHYRLLNRIEEQPDLSQRQLSRNLRFSVGKRNNEHKLAYAFILTPQGVTQKAGITVRFLRQKIAEYDAIRDEIDRLQREVAELPNTEP